MQKLMSVTKNITKSAFVLGFMLQAAYAMDDQGSDKRTPPVKAADIQRTTDFPEIMNKASEFAEATLAVNLAMATLIVEREFPNQTILSPDESSPAVMRTGSSLAQELDNDRAVRLKTHCIRGLATQGLEFERNELYNSLTPHDQDIVDALREKLFGTTTK